MLRNIENTSILVIDPFGNNYKYKLHSRVTDKIEMAT
jgi:hypothetical protein